MMIGGLFLLLFCAACGNDEAEPSRMEKDWYVIEYDPNAGEVDQLIYEIYKETGFAIFYSDTLGTQTRYDQGGNPYVYYELFRPGYLLSEGERASTITYTMERDEKRLKEMVELLRDYAFKPFMAPGNFGPQFKGQFGPHAFIILDILDKTVKHTPDTLVKDLGNIGLSTRYMMTKEKKGVNNVTYFSLEEMTEEDKVVYGWNLSMYVLQDYLGKYYTEEFTAYQDITKEAPEPDPNPTKGYECYVLGKPYNIKNYVMDITNPRKYGVLTFGQNNGSSIWMPSVLQDLSNFTRMIYTKSDAEIREEHADYEMVIRRYEALLKILKDAGLTHFIKK